MKYYFACECGSRNYVIVSQAGSTVRCACGSDKSVPSLSKLNKEFPSDEQLVRRARNVEDIVRIPALLMVVSSTVSIVLILYYLQSLEDFIGKRWRGQGEESQGLKGIVFIYATVSLTYNAFIVYGGIRMRQLRDYGLAKTAAFLCLIPCFNPALSIAMM